VRTSYAHRYFKCACGVRFGKVVEISPNETEKTPCECGKQARQEETQVGRDHNLFRPFWSDTMQCRINDREDLSKLRAYAKSKGLTNVGHTVMKPDRAAIRHNYDHD
jgi:hypothetical protein